MPSGVYMTSPDVIRYALVGALVALALFIRWRRMGKTQRLRPGTLWIVPTVLILLAAAIFRQFPPSAGGWLWVILGLAAGGVLGWLRARFIEVSFDSQTRRLYQRSSPAALIFIAVLVLVRWAMRSAVMLGDARWHFGAMLVSDIFIAFAIGVLSCYRIELYLRARRLLRGS